MLDRGPPSYRFPQRRTQPYRFAGDDGFQPLELAGLDAEDGGSRGQDVDAAGGDHGTELQVFAQETKLDPVGEVALAMVVRDEGDRLLSVHGRPPSADQERIWKPGCFFASYISLSARPIRSSAVP